MERVDGKPEPVLHAAPPERGIRLRLDEPGHEVLEVAHRLGRVVDDAGHVRVAELNALDVFELVGHTGILDR